MKSVFFLIVFLIGSSVYGDSMIDKKDFLISKMPYDTYCKLSLHANLKRSLRDHESKNTMISIELLELQLVTDIAYLNFVINNEDDNEYAKYVLNMIVYGLREGYIDGGKNLASHNLLVNADKNWHADINKIYTGVVIPEKQKGEFKTWFSKNSVKSLVATGGNVK